MISSIYPSYTQNLLNLRKTVSFLGNPFVNPENSKVKDVFEKTPDYLSESQLRVQKCETGEDLKDFHNTISKEFKICILDRPARKSTLWWNKINNIKCSQYLIKNKNDEITGAFHLFEYPNSEGEYKRLHIAEMCVPKKFQKTKTSHDTLKVMFNEIKNKAENFDYLTLDVDCDNKSLINMYKKLGFYIRDYSFGFYSMINVINPDISVKVNEYDEKTGELVKTHKYGKYKD